MRRQNYWDADSCASSDRTLYYDTGRPITEQDKVVSQSGTTLAMKLGRTDVDGKKHKVEVDFESRLLVLGEFKTVSLGPG